MSIGDRIRFLRERKELTQVELAARIGITQSAVSNLETDNSRRPAATTLLRLAAMLDCNPEWIITGKGEPEHWQPITEEAHAELLSLFGNMDEGAQQALLAAARAMQK